MRLVGSPQPRDINDIYLQTVVEYLARPLPEGFIERITGELRSSAMEIARTSDEGSFTDSTVSFSSTGSSSACIPVEPIIKRKNALAFIPTIKKNTSVSEPEGDYKPSQDTQDTVKFIMNNVNAETMDKSVTHIANLIRVQPQQFSKWLARNLLMRRVCSHNNNLSLYYQFQCGISRVDRNFEDYMREETYRQIKRLLAVLTAPENCVVSGFSDRQVIKNLGSWLGFLTIARNRPILAKDLDLCNLLLEAFKQGENSLNVVVPFVTRVMRSCRMSIVCGPHTAWPYSIIRVLAEIHRQPATKLSIKFEIECLLRAFGMKVNEVEPANVIGNVIVADSNDGDFPKKFGRDPIQSKMQLARELMVQIVVSERAIQSHFAENDADILDNPTGVDEELIMALNGEPVDVPSKDEVQRMLTKQVVELKDSHLNTRPLETFDFDYKDFVPNDGFSSSASIFDFDYGQTGDETFDYSHVAESLFFQLAQRYNCSVQIECFQNIFELITMYREQGMLLADSAEPFLISCIQCFIRHSYHYDPEVDSVNRHIYLFYADSLATIICLTAEELVKESIESSTKFIGVIFTAIRKMMFADYEYRGYQKFYTFPYGRLVLYLMWGLLNITVSRKDSTLLCGYQREFTSFLLTIQPINIPCFAFCWLDIIGNPRIFLSYVTSHANEEVSRVMFAHLLVSFIKFLSKLTENRSARESAAFSTLLMGFQRLICFLHHHPDVLVDFYDSLCMFMPHSCVQLRNIVLSATPWGLHIPDPIKMAPRSEFNSLIAKDQRSNNAISVVRLPFEADLLKFLDTKEPASLLDRLPAFLSVDAKGDMRYNSILVNTLVMFIGKHTTENLKARNLKMNLANICTMPFMEIFFHLTRVMCNEGRFVLFHSMVNQLRYPNNHTELFCQTLLHIFQRTTNGHVCEVLTRTMLERLIVNPPHPWGVVRTFSELTRNPSYDFWSLEFVRSFPEIVRVLQIINIV